MPPNAQILNVEAMRIMDGYEFCRHVSHALGRYDLRRPGFNLAAKAPVVTPYQQGLFMYPEEAQGLIFTGIQALKEYEETKDVSRATRERFVIEDTKDRLRNIEADHNSPEYRAMYDQTMAHVAAQMTGVESLVLAPVAGGVAVSIKPHIPKGPKA